MTSSCQVLASELQPSVDTLGSMARTDAILIPDRRHGSGLGSLAGQAGYLGARLGWHGFDERLGPVASYDPQVPIGHVALLETSS